MKKNCNILIFTILLFGTFYALMLQVRQIPLKNLRHRQEFFGFYKIIFSRTSEQVNKIEIFDIYGKFNCPPVHSSTASIDISRLQSGIYAYKT